MAELAETNTYLTDNIIKSSLALENLHNQLKDAGNELKRKQSELDELKNELSSKELNKKVLTTRNTAMREKINEFEGCFQQESESIRQEMKSFFKKLGIKVETNNRDDNLVELQIRFVENLNYSVTLVYDPVTEDYDRKFESSPSSISNKF